MQFVEANKGRIYGLGSIARDLDRRDRGVPESAHEAVSTARRVEILEAQNRDLVKKVANLEHIIELMGGYGDPGAGTSTARTTNLDDDDDADADADADADLERTPTPTP